MILTIKEAENILSRVFSQELAGASVQIEGGSAPSSNPNVRGPAVTMSTVTFDRVMKLMSKQPSMKIDAIKLYREVVPGTGLAEAKEYVERLAGTP